MSRSFATSEDPHLVVTDRNVVVTKLLLQPPAPISRSPITGLGQVVTTGDTAQRQDQRTPQVIFSDQTGGMGEFAYTETEGITSFTDSDCDTRFLNLVVLPPAPVSRGTLAQATLTSPWRMVGLTDTPTMFAWQPGFANTAQTWDGAAWTAPATLSGKYVTAFVSTIGRYAIGTLQGIMTSPDGLTWTAGFTPTNGTAALVEHDAKLYTIDTLGLLQWQTDPTATTGWTSAGGLLRLRNQENILQLLEWRDAAGRTVIYAVTTERLFWYDDDADGWHLFFDFGPLAAHFYTVVPRGNMASAFVSPRDGNLYLMFGYGNDDSLGDVVFWFSGTTNRTTPNLRGGLPTASRVAHTAGAGAAQWSYFWGLPRFGAATTGRLLAMNDQQGWGTLYTPASTATHVFGGGYYHGRLWVVQYDGTVIELAVPDAPDLPLYATRTYRTGATLYHEFAYTDGGTPNMFKQWLWVAVQSLDHTSANKVPGLAATCQIVVQYRRDVDTAWTTLGTLTSASTFPAVLPINAGAGVAAKEFKVRLGLSSGTTANTPVVTSTAAAYLRMEYVRYRYTAVVDLSATAQPFYGTLDRVQLARRMESWVQPGSIVSLAFAGGDYANQPAESTLVPNCTVVFSGQESPTTGPGMYTLAFDDVSPPASG